MIQKHIDSFRKANVPLCHSPFDGYPRSPIESSHSPSLLKFRPRKKSECNCCKTLLSSKMQSCASRLSSVASNDRRRLDHGAASLGVLPATEQGAIIAVSGSHRLRSLSKGDRQKATRKERGRRRVCRSGVIRTHRDCRGTRNVAPPNSVLQSLAICRRHKIKKQGLGIGRGSCQFWVCQSVLLQFMLVRLEGGLQRKRSPVFVVRTTGGRSVNTAAGRSVSTAAGRSVSTTEELASPEVRGT